MIKWIPDYELFTVVFVYFVILTCIVLLFETYTFIKLLTTNKVTVTTYVKKHYLFGGPIYKNLEEL